jgi:acyl carrier protein
METSEIKSKIRIIIAGMFDVKPEDIPDTKLFTELAKFDSMRALEFLAKLETEFNILIDPDKLYNMTTVDKTIQVVEGTLHADHQ